MRQKVFSEQTRNSKDKESSEKNSETISGFDYTVYVPAKKELSDYYIVSAIVSIVAGLLFYNSFWAILILFCFAPVFEKVYLSSLKNKRTENCLMCFKDSLYSVSASVASGKKLPMAINDAADQLFLLHGEDCLMAKELKNIFMVYGKTNQSIDNLLSDLGRRTGIEEILLFASSCAICEKNGGDLESVCLKNAYMIIEKIDFAQETRALLAEKKLDIIILLAMPLITLFFLSTNSFDYIEILYTSFQGRIIMSISLLMMALACLWSLRIMNVEI